MNGCPLCDRQRLVEIPLDVRQVFDADGQADVVVGHAGERLFFHIQLAVGGGRRVDGQRTGITDVRQMREQLQVINEGLARCRVKNILGESVLERDLPCCATAELSLAQFPAGMYVVEISIGNRRMMRAVVKE